MNDPHTGGEKLKTKNWKLKTDHALSVSDEGRGVPPDQLPHLFRKHAALAGSEQQDGVRGAGLGLAISKGLVEAHGGRIWAESVGAGRGTRFTFTILVVDDDPLTLRFVRDALAEAGYAPHLTGDPREMAYILNERGVGYRVPKPQDDP